MFPCFATPKSSLTYTLDPEVRGSSILQILDHRVYFNIQECSINLKRDGVGICLGKDVEKWSIEGFLTPPSFRYRVNYIGHLN